MFSISILNLNKQTKNVKKYKRWDEGSSDEHKTKLHNKCILAF